MTLPITLNYQVPDIFGGQQQSLIINSGLTTFVGPNGSGKTQVMRQLKYQLSAYSNGRKVRYLSAGRLGHLENYRSNYDGRRGGADYDNAQFGDKSYSNYRHEAETAFGDFHTLNIRTDLQIKVAERLRTLFKRNIIFDWDGGYLRVKFSRTDINGSFYSSAKEASGLLHLVVNLAALYDNDVSILLLDEPEVSLHPQLQSFLLREIKNASGDPSDPNKKLVIISTHSTEMIDIKEPSDLANIVFFKDTINPPVQVPPSAGELSNTKIRELIPRLGQAHKTAFFSMQPMLVEGISDSIICNAFDEHFHLYMGVAGTQIVPVIGKGQMAVVSKLMKMIGKKPIVLADLDAICDDINLINIFADDVQAQKAAQEKGHADLMTFARTVYNNFCQCADKNWSDIESIAVKHPYWVNRDTEKDEKVARRRTSMAIVLNSSCEIISSWNNSSEWLSLHIRLKALLDFLESAGCFILRKGAIESYYKFADNLTSSGKPSASIEEIQELFKQDESFIKTNYEDLLRALNFASQAKEINEANAVSELLLAVVSPVLHNLDKDTTDAEISSKARQIVGEKATIFTLEKVMVGVTPAIKVNLNTNILDVGGFPVILRKDCNPISEIKSMIGMV